MPWRKQNPNRNNLHHRCKKSEYWSAKASDSSRSFAQIMLPTRMNRKHENILSNSFPHHQNTSHFNTVYCLILVSHFSFLWLHQHSHIPTSHNTIPRPTTFPISISSRIPSPSTHWQSSTLIYHNLFLSLHPYVPFRRVAGGSAARSLLPCWWSPRPGGERVKLLTYYLPTGHTLDTLTPLISWRKEYTTFNWILTQMHKQTTIRKNWDTRKWSRMRVGEHRETSISSNK